MALKKYKPVTPGQRFKVISAYDDITTNKPEKSLLAPKHSTGGRNSSGKMTIRYRGGGHKQMYRLIDFKRNKDGVPATVKTIEYDPNRSARIALLFYADGEKRYIVAPHGIKVGQQIVSGSGVAPDLGNCLPVGEIPFGSIIHNIEMRPGQGGKIARSAGSYAQLMSRDGRYAIIKLPSGEVRMIHVNCRAMIGQVGNLDLMNVKMGKAGKKRYKGFRPHVRGVAQNPVDHPMGGGEGRESGGGHPVSPWGKLAKGKRTRNPRKNSKKFIVERRKK